MVIVVTVAVASLEPAAPSVDKDTVWVGTVERGTLLRQVRGHGKLVPEELRWVQAETTGRVEKIFVDPGQRVTADEVILELTNPEVERAAIDSENALRGEEAEIESLRITLISTELDQKAHAAEVDAEAIRASLQAEANRELLEKGLVSEIQLRSAEAVADALETRQEIEGQRLEMTAHANVALLEAKQAELDQQRALFDLRAAQLEALSVRAGIDGVVQEVPLEIGQQAMAGTMLARVAEPTQLQAELQGSRHPGAGRAPRPEGQSRHAKRSSSPAQWLESTRRFRAERSLVEVRFDDELCRTEPGRTWPWTAPSRSNSSRMCSSSVVRCRARRTRPSVFTGSIPTGTTPSGSGRSGSRFGRNDRNHQRP